MEAKPRIAARMSLTKCRTGRTRGPDRARGGARPVAVRLTPVPMQFLPLGLGAFALAVLSLPTTKDPTMKMSTLEPTTRKFIEASAGGKPLHEMTPEAAHAVLTGLQSKPVALQPADVEDLTWPIGPTDRTDVRIVRPKGSKEVLPVVIYCHGGGWVLGDKITHDRLVRELANGVNATFVFVDYVNSPAAKHPTQNEQAYAAMLYVVEHAKELRVDASRLAIVGDSAGGAMAAGLTLMAKQRKGPKIAAQVLFYPVTDYIKDSGSYVEFADGPWLNAKTMKWMFDLQGLDGNTKDITAFPLRATVEELKGLPDALIIVDDDILRDEGEAYARKLASAGVRVTSVRYNDTVHDFVMLNPLAETPAVRSAIQLTVGALKTALHP